MDWIPQHAMHAHVQKGSSVAHISSPYCMKPAYRSCFPRSQISYTFVVIHMLNEVFPIVCIRIISACRRYALVWWLFAPVAELPSVTLLCIQTLNRPLCLYFVFEHGNCTEQSPCAMSKPATFAVLKFRHDPSVSGVKLLSASR